MLVHTRQRVLTIPAPNKNPRHRVSDDLPWWTTFHTCPNLWLEKLPCTWFFASCALPFADLALYPFTVINHCHKLNRVPSPMNLPSKFWNLGKVLEAPSTESVRCMWMELHIGLAPLLHIKETKSLACRDITTPSLIHPLRLFKAITWKSQLSLEGVTVTKNLMRAKRRHQGAGTAGGVSRRRTVGSLWGVQQVNGSISMYHDKPVKMSIFCHGHTFTMRQILLLHDLHEQVSSFNQLHLFTSIFKFCWCIKNNTWGSERNPIIAQKCLIYSQGVGQALEESPTVRFYDKCQWLCW